MKTTSIFVKEGGGRVVRKESSTKSTEEKNLGFASSTSFVFIHLPYRINSKATSKGGEEEEEEEDGRKGKKEKMKGKHCANV